MVYPPTVAGGFDPHFHLFSKAPSAPAAFDRLGDGNCMTSAMLPVRGRSRRDMEHGECRGVPLLKDRGIKLGELERI